MAGRMIIQEGLAALASLPAGATTSVGNFDGVHRGHGEILAKACRQRDLAGGGELVVVTFEPHPLSVLRPELAPARLSTLATKHALLASLGADRLIVLPPSPEVLGTTAEDFFGLLRDRARVRLLVEGSTFNFGKDRGGNIDRLREWCLRDGVGLVTVADQRVTLGDGSSVAVSSSLIRGLVSRGAVEDAAICLGRPFAIEGIVERGEGRGRTIGFPTANIRFEPPLLLAAGVYAARWMIDGVSRAVALSVGAKATFHSAHPPVIEAHMLDFSGDLYGREARVDVLGWVREQAKFSSLETLVEQLGKDVAQVRNFFATEDEKKTENKEQFN